MACFLQASAVDFVPALIVALGRRAISGEMTGQAAVVASSGLFLTLALALALAFTLQCGNEGLDGRGLLVVFGFGRDVLAASAST